MSNFDDIRAWGLAGKEDRIKILGQIVNLVVDESITYSVFFKRVQEIIIVSEQYAEFLGAQAANTMEMQLTELLAWQDKFYSELELNNDTGYKQSFTNPDYAVSLYGHPMGQLLSTLYSRFRGIPQMFIQQRYSEIVKLYKLYLELYQYAIEHKTDFRSWLQTFRNRIMENMIEQQLFGMYWRYCSEQKYYNDIIMNSDLSDLRYLFRYGSYIDQHVMNMAKFMGDYPEAELRDLSLYIVQSFKDGFERGHRSYQTKKYVTLNIPAGMERLGRMLINDLQEIGLTTIMSLPETQSLNKQYDYDHRFDMALYYDQNYIDVMLPAYEQAVNQMSDILKLQAGRIYVELFGETPFNPQNCDAALKFDDTQLALRRKVSSQSMQIFYKQYPQEETSFCIIAFPSTQIGAQFKEIFADTVKINLLDSLRYGNIQQNIIDVLDTADYVHVKGKANNKTDIRVKLHKISDPDKETNFENCVADVNIPVGEVFTSPLLTGTNGVLHVEDIYLRNLRFYNLSITFKDGMISDYSCSNFDDAAANRKYIEENLLMPHKTLPIGEFAIGTNTTAYQIAKKYDILSLLPILIIEKMGPHFAIGDTCYSREEDIDHFNFVNGKKIIGVENEVSALRHSDPMNAYTSVHTDITLPYEMLESITAVAVDGKCMDIIKDGLFVVPGTEELNIPLKEMEKQV